MDDKLILKEDITYKYLEYSKLCIKLSNDFIDAECYKSRYMADNFVIDENKSVKWNREEVQRRKQEFKDLQEHQIELRRNALKEVEDMMKNYIQQNFPSITDTKYSHMLTFLRENDETTYNYENGITNKIEYLVDLAKLICE